MLHGKERVPGKRNDRDLPACSFEGISPQMTCTYSRAAITFSESTIMAHYLLLRYELEFQERGQWGKYRAVFRG